MEANLAYAKIGNLTNANLRRANLYYAGFLDAHLGGADLRGADLTGAFYLSRIASGSSKPIYSESTIFKWAMSGHHSGEDSFNPAEAGWVFLSDAVPEPATLLLALLALAAAPLRVRCGGGFAQGLCRPRSGVSSRVFTEIRLGDVDPNPRVTAEWSQITGHLRSCRTSMKD